MDLTLFTIGFTKKTAEEFFRLLADAGVRKVIDLRENRTGQLQGFARFPDIAYFLQKITGAEYEYQPLLAPTPEIRKQYRSTHDWDQYETSFLELMEERQILNQLRPDDFSGNVALLCSEATPEKCHRRLVAEMLARHWTGLDHSVEIRHLVISKPVRRKKRKERADDQTDPV